MDRPVYEFRPLPNFFSGPVRRYADGKWIADDGEYDLAFIGRDGGAPICLMVEHHYQRNIEWSWLTCHWRGIVKDHPNGGNPWHYMLRDGETEWGGDWGRDCHINRLAGDSGMSKMCGEYHCSNGRHVDFRLDDPHIAAGLLRERDTKRIVTFPDHPICMYCGEAWKKAAA